MDPCSALVAAIAMPPFDLNAAIIVGIIVVAAAAIVISGGIATPFIAIQAGATIKGTILAVAAISLVTGVVAGTAAGLYKGHTNEIKRLEQLETVANLAAQLDIYFDPSPDDPNRATEFRCNVVRYDGTDLATTPTITTKHVRISGRASDDFFPQIDRELKKWFTTRHETDAPKNPRRMTIYMNPYPGEGIYENIKKLAEQGGQCIVNRSEGKWSSPVPSDKMTGR